ncbi:MAG TPA: hypothetical protein K8W20_12250 [Pseudomonas lactis]|uniref:Uncharacterized protein n=1 Tax=Pseudomonas lactis TaxID=1615674 RepID=A0A921NHR2_9PSED|nr:hypothetical protein [Pseudomonas lactis]HJH19473.1 hypothetical protein [Pseudomonas lactis]
MSNVNLVEVCSSAKKLLEQDPHGTENRAALEALAYYAELADSGELTKERLEGFLHGLAIVGTFTTVAYVEILHKLGRPLKSRETKAL